MASAAVANDGRSMNNHDDDDVFFLYTVPEWGGGEG